MIKVSNLNKFFYKGKKNENHVLKSVELEFEDTGLVCILGESGCGKTTLLNTIGGLDDFYSGEMDINGTEIKKYNLDVSEKVRNDNFGFVFQNYYLLKDYTVAYNIRLALNIYDISDKEKDERVDYVLEALDMLKYKKKLVSELSGGQQQRVSIARALVKSPKVILADEPTGNLDEENTIRTMSILKNISKDCLVIVVTHEKDIAKFFADRIIKIKDGEITKDKVNKHKKGYSRKDDNNIYLGDLELKKLEEKNVDLKLYFEKEDEEFTEEDSDNNSDNNTTDSDNNTENTDDKIKLKMAYYDGKLYIKNDSEIEVIMTTEESDVNLIDDKKPEFELEDTKNFDFSLKRLVSNRNGEFTFKEIKHLAQENMRITGKKYVFMLIIMLLNAILMTVGVANFMNTFLIDERNVVSRDSHYVTVEFESTGEKNEFEMGSRLNQFYTDMVKDGKYQEIYNYNKANLKLKYKGFAQIEKVDVYLPSCSYVSYGNIDQSNILYGRMPEDSSEIVIDSWLIYKFRNSASILSELLTSDKSFLNQTLVDDMTDKEFKIVGISNTEEPTIYMASSCINSLGTFTSDFTSTYYANKDSDNKFKNVNLKNDEIIITKDEYENDLNQKEKSINVINGEEFYNMEATNYKIVDVVDYKLGAKGIISDDNYQYLFKNNLQTSRKFIVYTDDTEKAIKYFKKMGSGYDKSFKLKAYVMNESQLEKHRKNMLPKVNFVTFLTLGIFIISIIMIYFTIKSNALTRSEELTVYRLIGISRLSILKTYMLEITLLTLTVSFPAVLITSIVLKFVASVPSLSLTLNFPWWAIFVLALIILVINNIISVIPVRNILTKPPAKLALKG
ncbi:MAG: ABC transporter ATP-binding protein [Lachnospiraceae bacterium]|nr:ABC transporter ATP-binding protein [Lachnospiraceae bacterium]